MQKNNEWYVNCCTEQSANREPKVFELLEWLTLFVNVDRLDFFYYYFLMHATFKTLKMESFHRFECMQWAKKKKENKKPTSTFVNRNQFSHINTNLSILSHTHYPSKNGTSKHK